MSRILNIDAWEYAKKDGEFLVADLHKAFNLVIDPEDWRGAIDAVIPAIEAPITTQAITFYTGTVAKETPVDPPTGFDGEFVRVTSVGYRNGPCGP